MDDSKAKVEKAKALAAALAQIEKQFGKGSVMKLSDAEVAEDIQVVSTGSLGLDIALGVGGLPRGRVVEIYGPEGTIRDYIHVQDVASGIVAVLQQGKDGNIYNVGTGIGASNLDLIRLLQGLADADGFSVRVNHLPERRFDVAANVLDSRKLSDASGWAPRISLTEGLAAMWRHGLQRKLEREPRP